MLISKSFRLEQEVLDKLKDVREHLESEFGLKIGETQALRWCIRECADRLPARPRRSPMVRSAS